MAHDLKGSGPTISTEPVEGIQYFKPFDQCQGRFCVKGPSMQTLAFHSIEFSHEQEIILFRFDELPKRLASVLVIQGPPRGF